MLPACYVRQPREVSIETLALCNARCTFCPYPTLERKGVEMPDGLIRRCIAEMSSWSHRFYFSPFKVNEPLLDKRLRWICKEFQTHCRAGVLRLFTNGSALTDVNIEWIAALAPIEHLWISLNSHNFVEYEQIMGLKFANTAGKLDVLHEWCKKRFRHPVVVSKVAEDDGAKNLEFVEYVSERWPRFRAHVIKRDGWLGYVTPGSPFIPDQPCARWYELSILATGVVALCCMDGTGEFAIGDIRASSLLDIYNSPQWLSRRLTRVSRKLYEPCARCTY